MFLVSQDTLQDFYENNTFYSGSSNSINSFQALNERAASNIEEALLTKFAPQSVTDFYDLSLTMLLGGRLYEEGYGHYQCLTTNKFIDKATAEPVIVVSDSRIKSMQDGVVLSEEEQDYSIDAQLGIIKIYQHAVDRLLPKRTKRFYMAIEYTSGFMADSDDVYIGVPKSIEQAAISEAFVIYTTNQNYRTESLTINIPNFIAILRDQVTEKLAPFYVNPFYYQKPYLSQAEPIS